jgi:hypothetical protein
VLLWGPPSGGSPRSFFLEAGMAITPNINTWPMNNVPGTIVTMMNPRHVRDVVIAGKVVYWKGALVGWDLDRLLRQVEQSREQGTESRGAGIRAEAVGIEAR